MKQKPNTAVVATAGCNPGNGKLTASTSTAVISAAEAMQRDGGTRRKELKQWKAELAISTYHLQARNAAGVPAAGYTAGGLQQEFRAIHSVEAWCQRDRWVGQSSHRCTDRYGRNLLPL